MASSAPPVGIDLGTTFSVAAYLDNTGRPQTIKNSEGDITTPSVVFFEDDLIVVGKEAVKTATLEPELVAQFAKRDMGQQHFRKTINGKSYPPEVIQSMVLRKIKGDIEAVLGPIDDVVITVPAFFNEPRRKATQDAGRLAGLNVRDIINEPTAAAVAYGVQKGFLDQSGSSAQSERIFIYDLGGGTFDVTVMEISGNEYKVLATDGNVKLGGIDWDYRLADFVAEKFLQQHSVDPRQDPSGMQRLLREAEDAKRALSARNKIAVAFEHKGMGVRVPVTREEFEEMTADLLERTRFTVVHLLRQVQLEWSDITRLMLVGGSTRMPMVAEMLERVSGKQVDRSLAADEAVAHGAAIYAGLLRHGNRIGQHALNVSNVNSHSLGVLGIERRTGRRRRRILIPANTPLPATESKRFPISKGGQRSVKVEVVEGGDDSGNNSTPIGTCAIRDLPPDLPEHTTVIVTFHYESNGRLAVRAGIPGLQREARLDIQRASGMSESELRRWAQELGQSDGEPDTASETAGQAASSTPRPTGLPDAPQGEPKPSPSDPSHMPTESPSDAMREAFDPQTSPERAIQLYRQYGGELECSASQFLQLAQHAASEKSPEEAIELFEKAEQTAERDPSLEPWNVALQRADYLCQLSREDEACDELRSAVERSPDQADLHLRLAEILSAAGSAGPLPADCLTHAARAVELRPDDTAALRLASRASWYAEKWMECLEYAQGLYGTSTAAEDQLEACLTMGLVYMQDDDSRDSAIEAFEAALEIDGSSTEVMSHLADCYWRTGRHEDSYQIAQKCLAANPSDEYCLSLVAEYEKSAG